MTAPRRKVPPPPAIETGPLVVTSKVTKTITDHRHFGDVHQYVIQADGDAIGLQLPVTGYGSYVHPQGRELLRAISEGIDQVLGVTVLTTVQGTES